MEGVLYDGTSGVRHMVAVTADGDMLALRHDGDPLKSIAAADLTLLDRQADRITLGHRSIDGWRLRLLEPIMPEIATLFPSRATGYGAWIDRIGLVRAAAAFTAASALVLAVGYVAPGWLAPLVPSSVERAYGEALIGDFGGKFCTTPGGQRALTRLTERLSPGASDINVRVVDVPIVNAAALPAGNIVLFEPILSTVAGPDELAGVLAHEIAHVRKRHVTAALIRQFGLGLIATALGGSTAGNVDSFVSLTFTRRSEAEADDGAIAMLNRSHVAPAATATFFRRLAGDENRLGRFEPAMAYLSSHPLSRDRDAKFVAGMQKGEAYTASLNATDWGALKAICAKK